MKRFLSLVLAVFMLFPCLAVSAAEWCEISLPSTIYGVVGKEMNVYFDNVILCNNLDNYQVDVVCSFGIQQEERWTYTPEAAGSFGLTIRVLKNGTEQVAIAETTVVVSPVTGTDANKKVLFIGDSWTENVYYVSYFLSRFNEDGDNVQLLGTMTNWNNEKIRYEGRSGWTTDGYCNKASYNSRTNPFYNSETSSFDLSYYLTQNSIETPDVVIIFLGINDVGQGITYAATAANLNKMIANIHGVSADIEIGIVLTPPPGGTQDGFGKYNKCANTRFSQKYGAFNLGKELIGSFDGKIDNVSVVPVNVNIDCINSYAYEEVTANAYSTVTIRRLVDNVHPAAAGYQQTADSLYGFVKSLF